MAHELTGTIQRLNRNIAVGFIVSFVVASFTLIISNRISKEQLAKALMFAVHNAVTNNDYREAITTLTSAGSYHFENIVYFDPALKIAFNLPRQVSAKRNDSNLRCLIYNCFYFDVETDSAIDGLSQSRLGTLVFVSNRFLYVDWLAGIWLLLLPCIFYFQRKLKMRFIEEQKRMISIKEESALGLLAQQVAHDIRSPLAALTVAEQELSALSEETRLMIRSAITRIKDIANGLLKKNSDPSPSSDGTGIGQEALSVQLLPTMIDSLVTEKRTQYRSRLGIKIEYNVRYEDYGIFARIQPNEFKRILSNLINNSIEALGDTGKIELTMKGTQSEITLLVSDNGQGIAPEVLPKLMQRGVTNGKAGGSGLGLFHARTQVEAWAGRLAITSNVGQGTKVTLSLPRTPAPHWFLPKLIFKPKSTVVVVDDDESIHQIWQGRFEKLKTKMGDIKVKNFSTAREIESWIANQLNPEMSTVFLFDYELLGQDTNGLALIEKLGLAKQSVLVTSRFEDPAIRQACERLGVKLIPKGMAGFIPIEFCEKIDAILIDDDELVHLSWSLSAKKRGYHLLGFKSAEDFFKTAAEHDPETPLFIDSNLGVDSNGLEVRGEEVSYQLSKMGFKNLYLATGYPPDPSQAMPWLKAIRGKDAPFDEPGFRLKGSIA